MSFHLKLNLMKEPDSRIGIDWLRELLLFCRVVKITVADKFKFFGQFQRYVICLTALLTSLQRNNINFFLVEILSH